MWNISAYYAESFIAVSQCRQKNLRNVSDKALCQPLKIRNHLITTISRL